jgi:carbon storage regulator
MLVLSRRVGEEIVINGNIRVAVVAVKGDRIRIGIDAPKNVEVDRSEVFARREEFRKDPVKGNCPIREREESIMLDLPEPKDPSTETLIYCETADIR